MSGGGDHDKWQQRQDEDEATTAAIGSIHMAIFAVKDDIFQNNVCSYLDRKSICELVKEENLSNHFHLCKHFCGSHGTRILPVSKEERKKFKRRKQQTNTWLTCDHPGCIDCSKGLDGQLRCIECNEFTQWEHIEECDTCHREACRNCVSFVHCDLCDGDYVYYCRDNCFDGFYCSHCDASICNGCDKMITCENETCDKAGCSDCAMQLEITQCFDCKRNYCQECNEFFYCDACEEIYCRECEH